MVQLLAAPVFSFTTLTLLLLLMPAVPGCQGFVLVRHSPLLQYVSLTQAPFASRSFPSLFGISSSNNNNNNNNINDAPVVVSLFSPREYIMQGTEQFRQGKVQRSIDSFNEAGRQLGNRPYLWQRGISLYYVDEFAAASQQFRDDVVQSPLDVEEIVWDTACLARLYPDAPFPPAIQLSLPAGKKDRRPIMATVYNLFRGDATERDLAEFGHQGSPADEFYALFYLGLYNDARGDMTKAEYYMKGARLTKYATLVGSKDYMVDVAKVHCQARLWS